MQCSYSILKTSDPQLVECIKKMVLDKEVECTKIVFNQLGMSSGGFQLTPALLNAGTAPLNFIHESSRLFSTVDLICNAGRIRIVRHKPGEPKQDTTEPFDRVDIIAEGDNKPNEPYTRLIAASQKHLHRFSISGLGTFLGEDAQRHYQERDAALAQMQHLITDSNKRVNERIQEYEDAYLEKQKLLEQEYRKKKEEQDDSTAKESERLDAIKRSLDKREEELNLQEPKAERRRVFDELKETMAGWSKDFTLSTTNIKFRILIRVVYIALLLIFALVVVFYVVRPIVSVMNELES